ncbi:response regulator [Pacificispira sp.]|uniref:response regulator n=1 Tax=Pacificispira sp. TaxID=2888761 RepID=UPI003BABBA48
MAKSDPYMSCRLLIVDDNQPTRLLLREMLKSEGLTGVREASGGAEALRLLETYPFDVVLADMEMPDMSGLDLLRKVRRDGVALNRAIPFVFVTAHANPALVGKARELGVTGYVLKPITIGQVRAKLDLALRQGRALHDSQAKPKPEPEDDAWEL